MSYIQYNLSVDQTGYSNSAKDTCYALIKSGLPMTTNMITTRMSFQDKAKSPEYEEILKYLNISKDIKINICEQIPILWENYFKKNTRNIGRFFWETDKLSDDWVNIINNGLCNEVWVPCEWNKQACINSGVRKPVFVIPPIIKFNTISKEHAQEILPIGGNPDAFRFYSIFQWSNRKNGEGLLRAYFKEFSIDDNVILVLKTYGTFASFVEKQEIKNKILELKYESSNPKAPPVCLLGDLLTPEQISAIHSQCNVFISTTKGEGWNLPLAEAIVNKKPIITTKIGGLADYLSEEEAYIIPNSWEPVNQTQWSRFYTHGQNWGKVDDSDIQKTMRLAYNECQNCNKINNYDKVLNEFTEEKIIELIKERLSAV